MAPAPKTRALPPGTISTHAAARVSGLHWRTLLRWVERGVLNPALCCGERGSKGSTFGWNLPDVVAARTIREMREAGLSAQRVRRAAATVTGWGASFSSVALWSDGVDAFRVLPEKRLVSVVSKPGQHRIFPLGTWADEIEKRFARELKRRERAA